MLFGFKTSRFHFKNNTDNKLRFVCILIPLITHNIHNNNFINNKIQIYIYIYIYVCIYIYLYLVINEVIIMYIMCY